MNNMRSNKSKKVVSDVIERIIFLRSEIKTMQDELKSLETTPLQETSPIPSDFDYKEAMMKLFTSKPSGIFKMDDVINSISSEHGFVPDRQVVGIRIGYLVDTVKKLERVEGKRGFYRLRKNPVTPNPTQNNAVDVLK